MNKYNKESKKSGGTKADIKLSSPFEIWPAIQFGGFYVLISVLMNTALYFQIKIKLYIDSFKEIDPSKAIDLAEKSGGFLENLLMYIISFISGFADVDAIYIKVSQLVASDKMLASVGVITITIAVIMNTLVKILYIKLSASKYLGQLMMYLISAICLVGAIVTYFVV